MRSIGRAGQWLPKRVVLPEAQRQQQQQRGGYARARRHVYARLRARFCVYPRVRALARAAFGR
eukprot:6168690-Lingulodinium_polyedra.AAC.1